MPATLIAFRGPIELIERSNTQITARFRDADGFADVIPTNAYYRLDDASGEVLADWSALTPAASIAIPITAERNRILNCARDLERKTLTVMSDRGLSSQFAAVYSYNVRNQAWLS